MASGNAAVRARKQVPTKSACRGRQRSVTSPPTTKPSIIADSAQPHAGRPRPSLTTIGPSTLCAPP